MQISLPLKALLADFQHAIVFTYWKETRLQQKNCQLKRDSNKRTIKWNVLQQKNSQVRHGSNKRTVKWNMVPTKEQSSET